QSGGEVILPASLTKKALVSSAFFISADCPAANSGTDCAAGSRRTCLSRKSRRPASAGSAGLNRRAEDSVPKRRRHIRIPNFRRAGDRTADPCEAGPLQGSTATTL